MYKKKDGGDETVSLTESVRRRLPEYYRVLIGLYADGFMKVSSVQLAQVMGLAQSQVRTDMLSIGCSGQKGYGYNTAKLYNRIGEVLQVQDNFSAVIIGDGELASIVSDSHLFTKRGIKLAARFSESDSGGWLSLEMLERFCADNAIDIMIFACEGKVAQKGMEIAERAGIRGVMNFSDTILSSSRLAVRNLRFEDPLMMLCSELKRVAED